MTGLGGGVRQISSGVLPFGGGLDSEASLLIFFTRDSERLSGRCGFSSTSWTIKSSIPARTSWSGSGFLGRGKLASLGL